MVKRTIDIFFSVFLLVAFSPVFLFIAIIIKKFDHGKVIFKQERMGKNGQHIVIYKFRTMVENADAMISMFNKKERQEFFENYKLKDDFRVTKIGKILRKYNLDELPQLLNILKGDMSFVGPRPIVKNELEYYYSNNKCRFLSVKPGLMGYWTSFDRSNMPYSKRVFYELYYVEHKCLSFDFKCFMKTMYRLFR